MAYEELGPGREMDPVDDEEKVTLPENGGRRSVLYILVFLLLIGAGAFLFYRDMNRDFRHGIYRCSTGRMLELPVAPDPEKTRETAAGIGALAQAHPEIRQYMMLVPSPGYIQKRFLPEGFGLRDQAADLAAIRTQMPAGLRWIDLTETFIRHEGEKLYYATDPHLTGWGSRYAAKEALEAMEAELPDGEEICYLLSNSFLGKYARDDTLLHRFLDSRPERVEIYVPEQEVPYYRVDASTGSWSGSLYRASEAEGMEPLKVFFGGVRPLTEIYTAAVNGETLLVVGDETADTVVPMFVSSYEKIIFMHPSKCSAGMEKLIKKYQPTGILYLYGANTFMTDRALLRALGQ